MQFWVNLPYSWTEMFAPVQPWDKVIEPIRTKTIYSHWMGKLHYECVWYLESWRYPTLQAIPATYGKSVLYMVVMPISMEIHNRPLDSCRAGITFIHCCNKLKTTLGTDRDHLHTAKYSFFTAYQFGAMHHTPIGIYGDGFGIIIRIDFLIIGKV